MLNQQTLEKLRALRLLGMVAALEQQISLPQMEELSFDDRLGILVDQETLARENRRCSRLLSAAKLRLPACAEDIDYRHPRGLDKSQVSALISCQWMQRHQNLCLVGATGTGKTFMACALGNQACRQGLSVNYFRLPRLQELLKIAHGDGSYARLMNRLMKTDLLILDDWGIKKMGTAERNDLMEMIEDRHGLKSTLIGSQLPIDRWHDYLGEATLADAILDRLLHNAHRLELKGESLRKTKKDL